MEHARSIRFSLEPLGEQKVLIVECQPSRAPAFLKQGKTEDFYVRVGAGTRKLSMSQMLAYLTDRNQSKDIR